MKFSLERDVTILMGCSFDCRGNLSIGRNSVVNEGCRLDTRGNLVIGSNVSISSGVVILTASHDSRSPDFAGIVRPVTINDYAWIGLKAIIMPGVTIGKGAVVAAGAVVTKSVEAGSTVAGVPARLISSGRSDLNYQLSYRRLFH